MPPQTQTRKILIKVDTTDAKGLKEISDKMGMLNKSTKSLSDNMGFLTNAFRSWLGYLGARELINFSDEMQNLNNRLKISVGGAEAAQEAMKGISEIADRTYQSVGDVGQAFNRLALSLKGTGASTKETLALTETLINTFRTSGATTTETVNTLVQLSQAFSSGELRGQELRSVMEQNATLATILRKELGNDIYKKAKEGAISTAEVLKVLAKNQKTVNEQAKELTPTFEQSLTKAMNKFKLSIGQVNEEYKLSAKFASLMEIAAGNLSSILVVLAASTVPLLVSAFTKLRVALTGLSRANVILLALTAIATLATVIYDNWEKVEKLFKRVKATLLDLGADVEEVMLSVSSKIATLLGAKLRPEAVIESVNATRSLREEAAKLRLELNAPAPKGTGPVADPEKYAQDLLSLANKVGKTTTKTQTLKGELAALNKEYLRTGDVQKYYEALSVFEKKKVTEQFKEGKTDVIKFHEALARLDLEGLNRAMSKGAISTREFNFGVASVRLDVLNEQLITGKMALADYTAEVIKLEDKVRPGAAFYTGIHDFIESVGTVSQGIARVTTQAFDHLADTLTEFVKKGKLDFASFTKAVLDDITAMVVRATIVRPLAQGLLGLIGVGLSSGVGAASAPVGGGLQYGGLGNYAQQFANGGIMTSMGQIPLNKYATGGIADSPQMALFGEGRKPEAYVPLPDGRSIPVKMDSSNGGISIVQNITIATDGSVSSDDKTTGDGAKQLADMMKRVAIDTIISQKRPGGVLS